MLETAEIIVNNVLIFSDETLLSAKTVVTFDMDILCSYIQSELISCTSFMWTYFLKNLYAMDCFCSEVLPTVISRDSQYCHSNIC